MYIGHTLNDMLEEWDYDGTEEESENPSIYTKVQEKLRPCDDVTECHPDKLTLIHVI